MKSKVTLWPSGQVVEVDSEKSLFAELKGKGIGIKSSCGGCASCALCVVEVRSGAEYLSEMTFEEKQLLGNVFHITSERLSCQTYVRGPVSIDITAHLDEKAPATPQKTVRRTPKEQQEKVEEKALAREPKKPKPGGFRRPKKFDFND